MSGIYMNADLMTAISVKISERLGRQLNKSEQIYVVDTIRKTNKEILKHKQPLDIIELLTNTIIKTLRKEQFKPMDGSEYFDMHENLKKYIGTTSESNVSNSIFDTLNKIPKDYMGLTRTCYFLLDSRYRNTESTSNKFIWDYANSKTQQNGSVNILGDIRDIISISIHSFRIPSCRYSNYHKRITVLIHEFSAQSFIAHENRKFHFSLPYLVDNNFLDVNNLDKHYKYHFEKPFTTIPSITVSFGNPLRLINLDDDSGKCFADYVSISPLTEITTQTPHNINTNDLVFFSNFNAGARDTILKNAINHESGFIITVINANKFSINYNTSGIIDPTPGLIFDVYYDSKRFYIPFEMEYIKPSN